MPSNLNKLNDPIDTEAREVPEVPEGIAGALITNTQNAIADIQAAGKARTKVLVAAAKEAIQSSNLEFATLLQEELETDPKLSLSDQLSQLMQTEE